MKPFTYILIILLLLACGGPEPRRPVEVRSGSFIRESVQRNKELLALEENLIKEIIARDSIHEYLVSASGFWYYYNHRNEEDPYKPEPGDLVRFQYNVLSLSNDTIYSTSELGTVDYLVDKEDRKNLFPGLRNSLKLLREKETATFLYPSSLAFGYPGDSKRIGTNIPVKSTITLLQIEKQQDSVQN